MWWCGISVFIVVIRSLLTLCVCSFPAYCSLLPRRVWDIETGECRQTLEGHSDYVRSVGITPDGRTAISGGYDEAVRYGVRCMGWFGGGLSCHVASACGRRAVCVFVLCAILVYY